MIQRILAELSSDKGWRTVHLPFHFTPDFQSVRQFRFAKILELFAVWGRFLRLVIMHGRPDILLYPSGGPQTVPVVRDILLLPLFCALSRKAVVQFHAAGIADRLAAKHGLIEKALTWAYRQVEGAIVMTGYNRCDPLALGIPAIDVIPHRLPDENPEGALPDYSGLLNSSSFIPHPPPHFTILYAGHLYDLKGTPQLLEAFGAVAQRFPWARLVLMGEFLPPYSEEACRARCRGLGIEERVEITGVLRGEKKAAQFRAAHLFVFPTIAPYESFGLVLAEAMMWGLPIVATDWRGNRDVAGPDARYVPVDDSLPLHIADAIRSTLDSPASLAELSHMSRARFEQLVRLQPGQSDYQTLIRRLLGSD
jgi:glycosyltransferase involved in cell wall biosynthesis